MRTPPGGVQADVEFGWIGVGLADAFHHDGPCLPALRRRTLAKERSHPARSTAGALPRPPAPVHAFAQGSALRPSLQESGGRRPPGPPEHTGDQTHLRRLPPDAHLKWVGQTSGGAACLRGHAPARQKRRRACTRRALGLCGEKDPAGLAVAGALSAHPPDRRLHHRRPQPGRSAEFARPGARG